MRRQLRGIQRSLCLYGLILAVMSLWLLSSELSRSGVTSLPGNKSAALQAAKDRDRASRAAKIALVRGDRWSELGYTFADLEWADAGQIPISVVNQAKASASDAIALMPTNASVWLLLADLASRYQWQIPSSTECLKMSYYTAAHDEGLTSLRLAVASRSNVSADPEVERLFRREIEDVLTHRPALRPSLISAYAQASQQARHAIEDAVTEIDPGFAKTLPKIP